MIRLAEIRLPLSAAQAPEALLRAAACERLGLAADEIARVQVFKRSFDARKSEPLAVYIVDLTLARPEDEAALLARCTGQPHTRRSPDMAWRPPGRAPADLRLRPVVVGFGPCGIFAALVLAQMGFAPIVLERGRAVRERTLDTWGLWRRRVLHAESNVQFGEGGAGTFSDGKLHSQIKDPRHLGRKVLGELVKAGAPQEILFVAQPHIGTFKLVKVVEQLRAQIIALGGEVRFGQRVTDLLIEPSAQGRRLRGLDVLDQDRGQTTQLRADHVVLALGHSARDSFAMLYERGVAMQAKPFSIGLRVEHPQSLIDRARWGRHAGQPLLGAADYQLVHHAGNGRSVYSFCMCPGGTVVAATSEAGHVVTNGMSQNSRSERNANAALVVGVGPRDYPGDAAAFETHLGRDYGAQAHAHGSQHPLAGIVLQRQLESAAFVLGGSDYSAPGQLLGEFLAGQPSKQWGQVQPSYRPGVAPGDLRAALPGYAIAALREALPAFGRKIRGFDMHDAVLTGIETRTSSPLKINRNPDDRQSLNTAGLYPAGEGAGYAGGILSAGVDGIEVGEAVARSLLGGGA